MYQIEYSNFPYTETDRTICFIFLCTFCGKWRQITNHIGILTSPLPLLPLRSEPCFNFQGSFFSLFSLPIFTFYTDICLKPCRTRADDPLPLFETSLPHLLSLPSIFPCFSPCYFLLCFFILPYTPSYCLDTSVHSQNSPSFEHLILPVGSPDRFLFSLAFSRISFPSRVRRNSFVLPQENPYFLRGLKDQITNPSSTFKTYTIFWDLARSAEISRFTG